MQHVLEEWQVAVDLCPGRGEITEWWRFRRIYAKKRRRKKIKDLNKDPLAAVAASKEMVPHLNIIWSLKCPLTRQLILLQKFVDDQKVNARLEEEVKKLKAQIKFEKSESVPEWPRPPVSNTIHRRFVGGFESHYEYNRLLKNSAGTQFSFLQKFQETTQKNTKNLSDNVTELLLWTVHPPSQVGGRPRASTRRCTRPRPCARPHQLACARPPTSIIILALLKSQ